VTQGDVAAMTKRPSAISASRSCCNAAASPARPPADRRHEEPLDYLIPASRSAADTSSASATAISRSTVNERFPVSTST